jgi:hypothetical protein
MKSAVFWGITQCRVIPQKTADLKNYFNPTSNGLEILIFRHLRRIVQRLEVLLFTRRMLYQ